MATFTKESRLNVMCNGTIAFRYTNYISDETGMCVATKREKLKFRKSGITEHLETGVVVNHVRVYDSELQPSEDDVIQMILDNM